MYTIAVARLLFVTGTPADVHSGSGTFVGISVLRRALEEAGHRVDMIAPPGGRPVSFAGRLLFNLAARRSARGIAPEVVVGFDLDGLWLDASGGRAVASLKGVLAEEARFERGAARLRLRTEAFFERLHVRRVEIDLFRNVDAPPVDNHDATALLSQLGEHEVEVFAVHFEHRGAQLDLGSLRQRENRFQNLARGPARRRLARARTVRLADGRE